MAYFDKDGAHYSDILAANPKDVEAIEFFAAQMIKEAAKKKKKNFGVNLKGQS